MNWKIAFARAAGAGAGVVLMLGLIGTGALWYLNRPKPVPPWNRLAVTAKYADLFALFGNPLVLTFRYTVENHTNKDYELPNSDHLYKSVVGGKGLERDETVKWDGGPRVPAGQKVNIGIRVEYEYTGSTDDLDKLNAFTDRRLAEIDGFVALDPLTRYEVRFPTPPKGK